MFNKTYLLKLLRYAWLIGILTFGLSTIVGTGGSGNNGNGESGHSSNIYGKWHLDTMSYNDKVTACPGEIRTPSDTLRCSKETLEFYSDKTFNLIGESAGFISRGTGTWQFNSNVITIEIALAGMRENQMPSDNDLQNIDPPQQKKFNYNSSDDKLTRSYPEDGGRSTYTYTRNGKRLSIQD